MVVLKASPPLAVLHIVNNFQDKNCNNGKEICHEYSDNRTVNEQKSGKVVRRGQDHPWPLQVHKPIPFLAVLFLCQKTTIFDEKQPGKFDSVLTFDNL